MNSAIGFPMPKSIVVDEATETPTYAKFTAQPFQRGYGHTLGNSLRRVLHILGLGEGPKGSAVRRLKWYASWVQNVVRQFGPYLSWALDI